MRSNCLYSSVSAFFLIASFFSFGSHASNHKACPKAARKWIQSTKSRLLSGKKKDLHIAMMSIGEGDRVSKGELYFANTLCPLLEKALLRRAVLQEVLENRSFDSSYLVPSFKNFDVPRCPSKKLFRQLLLLRKQTSTSSNFQEDIERTMLSLYPQENATNDILIKKMSLTGLKEVWFVSTSDLRLLQSRTKKKIRSLLFQWLLQARDGKARGYPVHRLMAIRKLLPNKAVISDIMFQVIELSRMKKETEEYFIEFLRSYISYTKQISSSRRKKLILWLRQKLKSPMISEKTRKGQINYELNRKKILFRVRLVSLGDNTWMPYLMRHSKFTCGDLGVEPQYCPSRSATADDRWQVIKMQTFLGAIGTVPSHLKIRFLPVLKNILGSLLQMRKFGEMEYSDLIYNSLQRWSISVCQGMGSKARVLLPELKALHQRGALYTHPFIRYYQLKKVIDEIEQTTRKE